MAKIHKETSSTERDHTQYVRSWYGVTAEIVVENNLWHLVRVGGVALHHPPLVNLIMRRGQPRQERLLLSFLHEFGHLQTLPVAILHAVWLLLTVRWRNRHLCEALAMLAAVAVAHQAVWELASEIYVVLKAWREYRHIYREYPNRVGHFTFWGGMILLSGVLTRQLIGARARRSYGVVSDSLAL